MRRIRLILLLAGCPLAINAAESCAPPDNANAQPEFDASLLKEGRFVYRTTLKGEFIGETALEVRRAHANWRISMSAPKIGQAWEATFENSFTPVSAHLEMKTRSGPYEMSLKYARNEVTGEERRAEVSTPVSATLSGVVLDQRVDWAAVMALRAQPGASVSMFVYDPSTSLSRMLGDVRGEQKLSGAFGDAEAVRLDYRICKRDHIENYTVYATRQTPRYMLREDMPNGLVSELIRVEP